MYRDLVNVESLIEGELTTRRGSKLLGTMGSNLSNIPIKIAKLVLTRDENAADPGYNGAGASIVQPRFVGLDDAAAYVTNDYAPSFTSVASGLGDVTAGSAYTKFLYQRWNAVPYSPNNTGTPVMFLGAPLKMLKSVQGSPASPMLNWGINPAYGAALASPLFNSIAITAATNTAPIEVSVAGTLTLAPGSQVQITGETVLTAMNGIWTIDVIGASTISLRGSDGTTGGGYAGNGVMAMGALYSGANGSTQYDWRYTYQSADGSEGNPSQPALATSEIPSTGTCNTVGTAVRRVTGPIFTGMIGTFKIGVTNYTISSITDADNLVLTGSAGTQTGSTWSNAKASGGPIDCYFQDANVLVWGTDDTQISRIAIYRRGGILYDAYRFVGYVSNPGIGASTNFTDTTSDVELANGGARQMEFDNDPPVSSSVPTPLISSLNGGFGPGLALIAINTPAIFAKVHPGTLMHFTDGSPEDVIVQAVTDSQHVTVYMQRAHASGAGVEIDAITGQPCYLVMRYGESIVVAGDPNNPHAMYKSKTAFPESFPLTGADGSVNQYFVGTPSNGIVNMTEFRGSILSMNLESFFNVYVLNGSFAGAVEVTSGHGLGATYGWCNTGDSIWYYSRDKGIWSWDGGTSTKQSESIDPIFKNIPVGDIPPVDTSPNALVYIQMEYDDSQVRFLYKDTNGDFQILVCEPLYGSRWRLEDRTAKDNAGNPMPTTVLYREKDLGILISGRKDDDAGPAFALLNSVEILSTSYFTSDEYDRTTNNPRTSGGLFDYKILAPWIDFGAPNRTKLITQAWLEVNPNYPATPGAWDVPITIEVLTDYTDTAEETITIPAVPGINGRRMFSILPQALTADSAVQSYGIEARAISWRFLGTVYAYPVTYYTLTIAYEDTGVLTAGGSTDWTNCGTKFDKKFYQITIEFDPRGLGQTVYLDTISGKSGSVYSKGVQAFTLSANTGDINYGNGRALATFPISDGIVAKEVRVRQATTQADTANPTYATLGYFTIYGVDFVKEEYPPDVVGFTPPETGGYEYDKYANQVTLEVNTDNYLINVQVQADGATVETIQVQSTTSDRRRNITLSGDLVGKQWRLFVDVSQANIVAGGRFQLWSRGPLFKFQPADRGEVMHSLDWDALGSPWDKSCESVVFEWDNTGGADVTIQCDMKIGLNGQTIVSDVALENGPIVLSGVRGKKEFAFPPDTFCKLIKFYPKTTVPYSFRQWKYEVKATMDPPDITPWTEWNDWGYPYEKTARNIIITVDTQGTPATFDLQADGVTVQTFVVTTTYIDRRRVFACNPGLIGKLWRIVSHVGSSGYFKYWSYILDKVNEPPSVSQWSSYGQGFGYKGYKILKQMWVDYQSAGPLVLTFTSSTGTYTQTLPAHPVRAVERFLFPRTWGTGLNKSPLYDILITSNPNFKLWADMSGIEWIPCGIDRHQGYQQWLLSENTTTQI
jgi:hypothetical protein